MKTATEDQLEQLKQMASKLDAAIIFDRDGDVALLGRIYDDEGKQTVRYAPDPCCFHPVEEILADPRVC